MAAQVQGFSHTHLPRAMRFLQLFKEKSRQSFMLQGWIKCRNFSKDIHIEVMHSNWAYVHTMYLHSALAAGPYILDLNELGTSTLNWILKLCISVSRHVCPIVNNCSLVYTGTQTFFMKELDVTYLLHDYVWICQSYFFYLFIKIKHWQ